MPDGYYKAVTDELSRLGFIRKNGGKGSHEKWCGGADELTLTVPRKLKSRHTANGILKDSGSTEKF
jgi:hypothetical protein